MSEPCYKPYNEQDLRSANAHDIITIEQIYYIIQFHEKDTFFLHGKENVDRLLSIIPKCVQENYDSAKNLYSFRVLEWPHEKHMCLLMQRENPCHWQYLTEDLDTHTGQQRLLFHYHLDTFDIDLNIQDKYAKHHTKLILPTLTDSFLCELFN